MKRTTRSQNNTALPAGGVGHAAQNASSPADSPCLLRLLQAVASINRILSQADELATAIESVLALLGKATDFKGRVYIFKNIGGQQPEQFIYNIAQEWTSPGVVRSSDVPDRFFPFKPVGFLDWVEQLHAGCSVQGLARDLNQPAQKRQQLEQALSLAGVPIKANDGHWGVLGFDDCASERIWSAAEMATLEAVAATLGAAIDRDRLGAERIATEQRQIKSLEQINAALDKRGRLLTAAVAACETLLAVVEFDQAIPRVLECLGQAVSADHASLVRFEPPTPGTERGWCVLLHKWTASGSGTPPHDRRGGSRTAPTESTTQMDGPHPRRVNVDDYAEFWDALNHRRIAQILTEDLPAKAKALQLSAGVRSLACITLRINGDLWGVFSFEDCHRPRIWDEPELSLFQVAAAALEASITRNELVSAQLDAERKRQAAVLDERTRLAREFHDTLAQGFTGILMQLEAAELAAEGGDLARSRMQLSKAKALAKTSLQEARRAVWAIRPPTLDGELAGSLRRLTQQLCSETIKCAVRVSGQPFELPPEVGHELLRIAQEALVNALKHAGASQLRVQLQYYETTLELQVKDDGCGMDVGVQLRNGKGLGLIALQERTHRIRATLDIRSRPDHGTCIGVRWSLNNPE